MSDSQPPFSLSRLGQLLDTNGLLFLSVFLLAFIPLYPKLPLFDAIPGYLVKVRLEDILILITGCWWLLQVARGKVQWLISPVMFMMVYAVVGILSITSGIVILQTIPWEPLHVGKSALHFFRYLEYFSLFIFIFSAIRNLKQVKVVLGLMSVVVSLVVIYAIGQLYWEWPVFSTMNREYSKGAALTLGQDARVQSTFAGHYDLSAFLVILLPYVLIACLTHPRWWAKIWFAGMTLAGFWLLVETGSKFSLLAGLIGLYVTSLMYVRRYRRIWLISAWTTATLLAVMMFGGLFIWLNPQNQQILLGLQTLRQSNRLMQVGPLAQVVDKFSGILADRQLEALSPVPEIDSSPSIVSPPEEAETEQPQWSENTLKYGLSMGIRLDTLWPQALKGLARNVLVGSGYGTLNKTGNTMFVEADSTDNNLLRTLGETGVLGFLTFYGIVWLIVRTAWQFGHKGSWATETVRLGLIGAVVGILLNGFMIDVFVASKVAFTFWAMAGLSLKTMYLASPREFVGLEQNRLNALREWLATWWPALVIILLLLFLVHRNPFVASGQIANLAADPSATTALTTVHCWLSEKVWALCGSNADIPTTTSFLYGGYLLFFYSEWQHVGLYYYANVLLACLTLLATYIAARVIVSEGSSQLTAGLLLIGVLFVTQLVLIPTDANLALTLVATILAAGSVWTQKKAPKWLLFGGAVLIVLMSTLPAIEAKWWGVIAAPLWCLGSAALLEKIWKKYLVRPRLKPVMSAVLFSLSLMAIFLQPTFPAQIHDLKLEYRATSTHWGVQSTRVLNDFFSEYQKKVPVTNAQTPKLISAINPGFIELYRKYPYTAYPMTTITSDLSESFPATGSIYLTNAAIETPDQREAFRAIRLQNDLDLLAEGCADACNIYQLNTQPSNLSQTILQQKSAYSFIVFNQIFSLEQPASLKLLQAQLQLLDQNNRLPDFVIAIAEETSQIELKLNKESASKTIPIFFVSASTSRDLEKAFLSLRTPHDLILFLNSSYDGKMTWEHRRQQLNAVLDAQVDPSLKNVFVVSDRLQWLDDQPGWAPLAKYTERTKIPDEPSAHRRQFLSYLDETEADKIYLLGGDLGLIPRDLPALFYETSQDTKITYVGSSVRWRPNDVYLSIQVDEFGKARVEAVNLRSLEPLSIGNYGSSYWSQQLPELTPKPVVPDGQVPSPALNRTSLLIGFLASIWLANLVWHWTTKPRQNMQRLMTSLIASQSLR